MATSDACRRLLAAGIDINAPDKAGWTALHSAVSGGQVQACAFLIEHGADLHARGDDLTPMQLAVYAGEIDVVEYFVRTCGDDLAQVTSDGAGLEDLAEEIADNDEMKQYLAKLRSETSTHSIAEALRSATTTDSPAVAESKRSQGMSL